MLSIEERGSIQNQVKSNEYVFLKKIRNVHVLCDYSL